MIFILTLCTSGAEMRSEEVTIKNGKWLKITGVVDTIYKEKKFRVSTEDDKFIITTKKQINNLAIDDELCLYGAYHKIDSTKNRIRAKVIWHSDTVIYKEVSSNPFPDSLVNTVENRAVHYYRQKKIGIGAGLVFLGATSITIGTISAVRKNNAEPVELDSATTAFFGDDGLDIDIGGPTQEQFIGSMLFLGGASLFIGLSQLVIGIRAPKVELENNDVSLSFALEYDIRRKGIYLMGKF